MSVEVAFLFYFFLFLPSEELAGTVNLMPGSPVQGDWQVSPSALQVVDASSSPCTGQKQY